MLAQHVELLDTVCYDFPELTIVTRHGCEPVSYTHLTLPTSDLV